MCVICQVKRRSGPCPWDPISLHWTGMVSRFPCQAVRDGVSFVPPINSTISQKSDRLILWAVVQDMDVDNDLGDVAESEKADSPKRSAKKIPLVV